MADGNTVRSAFEYVNHPAFMLTLGSLPLTQLCIQYYLYQNIGSIMQGFQINRLRNLK